MSTTSKVLLATIAWSLVLTMTGVDLGLMLYPHLFLDEPFAWSLATARRALRAPGGLFVSACIAFVFWRWARTRPGNENRSGADRSTRPMVSRLYKLLLPVAAFLSGSTVVATASAFGPILELPMGSPWIVGLMLLVTSGGGFALLVTIALMVIWLREFDWFREYLEVDRDETPGAR